MKGIDLSFYLGLVVMREIQSKEMCHERLAGQFDQLLSDYDTDRRVSILVDRFLGARSLQGLSVLDVGCGLGFFSAAVAARGASVTSCDLGSELLRRTAERVSCRTCVADALNLEDTFGEGAFDIVVSSECIEHTPDPKRAVRQMIKVTRQGGFVSLSTPNVVWQPAVRLASLLRIRQFDGFENFSSWFGLRKLAEENGCRVVQEFGLHLFPFQFGMHNLSTLCDANLQFLRYFMINICMLLQKV